jgi:Leucine-rich repeat (LRR) protein
MSELKKHPLHMQAVEDFLKQFAYGDIVSHSWLEEHFGMPSLSETKTMTSDQFRERQFEWLANVEAFKGELLKSHQVCLQSVRGKGYRWVPPHEQTGLAVEEFDRNVKKVFLNTGSKLRNLRITELNDDQRRANLDTLARFSALKGMTKALH